MNRTPTLGAVVVVALVTTGCARMRQQPGGLQLTPAGARITDETIFADYRVWSSLQDRLRVLNEKGTALDIYHMAKAQALLDFAFDEYHENDRSDVVGRAVGEAQRVIGELESGGSGLTREHTPLESGDPVRPDLWRLVASLKADPRFACAGGAVARTEVALMHAAHEQHDGGWRRARPQVEIAEATARQAQREIDSCGSPHLER